MSDEYTYWLLGSAELAPLVVIANSCSGAWVHEVSPSNVPSPPIEFLKVRKGTFGPVLQPAGLVLFRDDLLTVLRELSVADFAAYPATIKPPQSEDTIENYQVVKIPSSLPLASLTVPAGRPALSVVEEAIDAVLVSSELRALLETNEHRVPDLAFSEPLFVGGTADG